MYPRVEGSSGQEGLIRTVSSWTLSQLPEGALLVFHRRPPTHLKEKVGGRGLFILASIRHSPKGEARLREGSPTSQRRESEMPPVSHTSPLRGSSS